VLLGSAFSGGTIAAVRNLGAAGIDVRVISSQRLNAAAWSRYVSRSYPAPPESDDRGFLQRLLAIGADDPGQTLLPTSDQTAWLYAEHATLLDQVFCRYQPSLDGMRRILDKKLLTDAAKQAGLPALPTWDPESLEEVVDLAPSLPYPILIKPRTHVYRLRNDKGLVARSAAELVRQYQHIAARERVDVRLNPHIPDARRPILQKFIDVTNGGVHSVTGFIDRTGELFVARHAVKVLQRSRPVGIGICFESRPATPLLEHATRALCRELGYFGIFEVEFIWSEGRWNVIDFNPRLFGQIGMDIRRGMPLPLLACLGATGDSDALRDAVAKAKAEDTDEKVVFFDRFTLRALLLAQTVTLRISEADRAHWRAWTEQNAANSVDLAADSSDPRPGFIHAISEIYRGVRAFPRFLRTTPRPSADMAPALAKRPS
jgi:predicted ATP-grasp superfamily ATP-dependent carboligase